MGPEPALQPSVAHAQSRLSPRATENGHASSHDPVQTPSPTSAAGLMHMMRLNQASIHERKSLLGLDASDEERVQAIAVVVGRHAAGNVVSFFQQVAKSPTTRRLSGDVLARAQRLELEHLESMVGGTYDDAYVEERLVLSLLYYTAGVDVHVFAAAFHGLHNNIKTQVREAATMAGTDPSAALDSLQKVAFLDLGLCMEALVALRQAAMRQVSEDASAYARSLIEASPDPLVTISPDGKVTDVNAATIRVTGLPRERLIGTDFLDYFTEPGKAREGYQQVFSKGSVTDYPLTIRHTSGRLTDVLYNATLYKDATGMVLGVFAAARDVTQQKAAEAELAEQRKREMARLAELERFQRLTVGRELRMVELKGEIEELGKRLKAAT